jgi:hypothetical protein
MLEFHMFLQLKHQSGECQTQMLIKHVENYDVLSKGEKFFVFRNDKVSGVLNNK